MKFTPNPPTKTDVEDYDWVDELVDKQLANPPRKGLPAVDWRPAVDRCPNCLSDWHGLPRYECGGATLSRREARRQAIKSHSYKVLQDDTPRAWPVS